MKLSEIQGALLSVEGFSYSCIVLSGNNIMDQLRSLERCCTQLERFIAISEHGYL